jgi:hypothetical protein
MVLDVVAADRVVEAVQTTRRLHPGLVVREEARNAAAADSDSEEEESQTCQCAFSLSNNCYYWYHCCQSTSHEERRDHNHFQLSPPTAYLVLNPFVLRLDEGQTEMTVTLQYYSGHFEMEILSVSDIGYLSFCETKRFVTRRRGLFYLEVDLSLSLVGLIYNLSFNEESIAICKSVHSGNFSPVHERGLFILSTTPTLSMRVITS